MGGFRGETGVSRFILRVVSLLSAVGGIVAVSGIDYYAQQFYDYIFLGLCGLWSLINIGLLCFKRSSHPGYCILFDMMFVAASAFLVTVSGVGAAFKGYDLIGRGIAAVVFAAVEFVVHFVLFMLACADFHARRRRSIKKPYGRREAVEL